MTGLWFAVSGQEISVGDEVKLGFHPDEIGVITGVHERGLPTVEVTEGPNKGTVRQIVYPADIEMRRNTRSER